jgi:hypothetical protein
VDIRRLGDVPVMANTNDPREFYRLSKIVLMRSLWRESLGNHLRFLFRRNLREISPNATDMLP